jgi:hypothetical protein
VIETIKGWFLPEGLTKREKIALIREQDAQLSEEISKQFEELERALDRKRECKKSSK